MLTCTSHHTNTGNTVILFKCTKLWGKVEAAVSAALAPPSESSRPEPHSSACVEECSDSKWKLFGFTPVWWKQPSLHYLLWVMRTDLWSPHPVVLGKLKSRLRNRITKGFSEIVVERQDSRTFAFPIISTQGVPWPVVILTQRLAQVSDMWLFFKWSLALQRPSPHTHSVEKVTGKHW